MRLAEVPPRLTQSRLAVVFAALLGGIGAGYFAARQSALDLLIGAVVVAVVSALVNWRAGVYVLLIFVTVEGFIGNLLYPSPYPTLFKDGLVIALYIGMLASLKTSELGQVAPRSILLPFGLLTVWSLVEIGNPSEPSVLVGLVGLRVLLLYIPLFFAGMWIGRDPNQLSKMAWFVLLASTPVTLFGIFEYFAGPSVVNAMGPGFAQGYFIVGGEAIANQLIFRPASTFAFTGHFGSFLFFITILALGTIHMPLGLRRRLVAGAILCVTLVAVVLQSQRTNWVLLPIAVVAIYAMNRRIGAAARMLPLLAGVVLVAITVGAPILANRLPGLLSHGKIEQRVVGSALGPFVGYLLSPVALFGNGTGSALGAARYVNQGLVPSAFESGWVIPLYMFGILGVALYLWLYGAVLNRIWRNSQTIDPSKRWTAVAILVYCALTAATLGPINYPPQNIYFWFFAGVASAPAFVSARLLQSRGQGDP